MRTSTSPPMRSSNPALREDVFTATRTDGAGTMTVQGTVNKTAWLLVLALAPASASWVLATAGGPGVTGWAIVASLVGLGVGIAIQAVALTFGVLGAMLVLYRTGVIKVTQRFRAGVLAATLGHRRRLPGVAAAGPVRGQGAVPVRTPAPWGSSSAWPSWSWPRSTWCSTST